MNNKRYRDMRPFTRKQLEFVVEVMLASALDSMIAIIPPYTSKDDRKHRGDWGWIKEGVLETTGFNLSILYAQLTDDGLCCTDALAMADNFDAKLHVLYQVAWKGEKKWCKAAEKMQKKKGHFTAKGVFGAYWPDVRKAAKAFVSKSFLENVDHVIALD